MFKTKEYVTYIIISVIGIGISVLDIKICVTDIEIMVTDIWIKCYRHLNN